MEQIWSDRQCRVSPGHESERECQRPSVCAGDDRNRERGHLLSLGEEDTGVPSRDQAGGWLAVTGTVRTLVEKWAPSSLAWLRTRVRNSLGITILSLAHPCDADPLVLRRASDDPARDLGFLIDVIARADSVVSVSNPQGHALNEQHGRQLLAGLHLLKIGRNL